MNAGHRNVAKVRSDGRPLVSVVTPVHNGETYLRECIESVLAQTYPNWDYAIINNCSKDRTREIAEEYAARDSRIRVHNNAEFVGQIANHNIALRQISPESKYCKIVAADDWLFPDCLSRMVDAAEANPSVAIVGAFVLNETWITPEGLPYPSLLVSGRELCRQRLLGGPFRFGTPTAVLYRSDVVRSVDAFFNESNLHSDMEVFFQVLRENDFSFVHQVLTFNRVREGSVTSYSDRFKTELPGMLYHLLAYGPVYLSPQEVAQRVAVHLNRYYGVLCESVFQRRGHEFWRFHRDTLRELGHPLDYLRLGGLIFMRVLDLLLNPKRAFEALWRQGAKFLGRERAEPDRGAHGALSP